MNVSHFPTVVNKINISCNKLTEVPDFSPLQNLIILRLWGNNITQIIGSDFPVSVSRINLTNNNLIEVPDFSQLPNLQDLFLSENPVKNLEWTSTKL